MQKVVELFPDRRPIGHFIRVGTTGHQQLETLIESGREVDRAVVSACVAPRQLSLLESLRDGGADIVLETDAAELAALGRYQGMVKQAPWAVAGRPLRPDDWQGHHGFERISAVARFAVEHGFSTVLAPSHFLNTASDRAFTIDRLVCEQLRAALDGNGGRTIGIDYQLILPNAILRDQEQRARLVTGLKGLPFNNLWMRASGFGASATGTGILRYILAMRDFAHIGKPIVADNVAGLAGIAVAAFGAASAIAHGVGIGERFDGSEWHKVPKPSTGGGQPKRVLLPMLDRQITIKQLRTLADTSGGRRLISCDDRRCCPKGLEDTLRDPKAHYLYQRRSQIQALSRIPESRRSHYFVTQDLASIDRRARTIARLKISDLQTKELVQRESERIERVYHVLEHFCDTDQSGVRAAALPLRRTPHRNTRRAQR